jgi:ABC-type bacteriocin/lantibiotic exporter with double-glycine peptidase domain
MGTMRGGMGMGCAPSARRMAVERARRQADPTKKEDRFPQGDAGIWRLVRPRKWLLLLGLVLVAINRVAGLTLPFVARPFVNLVLRKHRQRQADAAGGAVIIATIIQAITSFSNTQLLSKAAQRMIADLRQEVQRHVGRLSVSFYDANRTACWFRAS